MKEAFDYDTRIHLGKKCGFSIIKIKNPKDIENGSYILQKIVK
ncbi:MAG: hypothetical protein ACRDAU_11315 [Clostridium sp.]